MINQEGVIIKKGDVLTWKNYPDRYEVLMAGPKRLKVQWHKDSTPDSYTYVGSKEIQPVIDMIKDNDVYVNNEKWIKPSARSTCPKCESRNTLPPDYLCRKCRFG
jgi:hypothetical protein